jgi:hypothetical protein
MTDSRQQDHPARQAPACPPSGAPHHLALSGLEHSWLASGVPARAVQLDHLPTRPHM